MSTPEHNRLATNLSHGERLQPPTTDIDQWIYPFDQIDEPMFPYIGGKAINLIILKKAGLPVPNGYSIPVNAHLSYLEHEELPDHLVEEIVEIKRRLGGKIAIRSSAICEDGTELSMAGVFQSYYVYEDDNVAAVVEQIFGQSRSEAVSQFMMLHGRTTEDVEMGLIIQELIEPDVAGVIYTGINGHSLLIQYVDGFGARLVDGETQGSAMLVDENGTILESTGFESIPLSSNTINQIREYSHAVEDLFPGTPQDIEFAYRDGSVYILQARPLTADVGKVDLKETPEDTLNATKLVLRRLVAAEKRELGTPTAIFSDANYSELLPRPKEMDIGIHMYVWGGSDGVPGAKQLGHASMGYLVGQETIPVISFIGGRTYFSIARNAGLYHIGFPETTGEYYSTLVHEYLDAVQIDPEKGAYPQMGLYLQDPTLEDLQVRFGDRAQEYYQVYQAFAVRMRGFADDYLTEFHKNRLPETTRFVEQIGQTVIFRMTAEQLAYHAIEILEHNRTKSYVDFVNGARLGFYYSQRLQNLLRKTLGIGSDEAKRLYSRLNQGLDGSAITESNLQIADAHSDEEAILIAQELIGHYSTGEMLEIRHKPMRDDPDRLRAYVRGIRQTGQYRIDFERQREARINTQQEILSYIPQENREELSYVMKASQTYMAVRETAKYYLTKEYLYLRDTLELLEARAGLESGDIYHLYPRELILFASNPKSMFHIIRSRKQAFENYAELDMPPVIRESDIDSLRLATKDDIAFTESTGKFLAEGSEVTGVIVNPDEFKNLDEVNALMRQYQAQGVPVILAATQMNLSYDPLIAQSSGLIIKNAGIVAHGAQRARELGKGAIGGIDTKILKTGTRVSFNPETRSVKKIEQQES